jgi:Mg2+ and Co2+ transporter CorA
MFLPLTFFAGVFGMNFQEDAGYTIEVSARLV